MKKQTTNIFDKIICIGFIMFFLQFVYHTHYGLEKMKTKAYIGKSRVITPLIPKVPKVKSKTLENIIDNILNEKL